MFNELALQLRCFANSSFLREPPFYRRPADSVEMAFYGCNLPYFCFKPPQSDSDVFFREPRFKLETSVIRVISCMPSKAEFSKIFHLVLTRMFFQIVYNVKSSFPKSFFQKLGQEI